MKLLNFALLGLSAGITHNGDGTGGSAPAVRHHLAHGGEEQASPVGIGPHAADGIVTKDGGYIGVGVSFPNVDSETPQGWLARIDPCPNASDYTNPFGTSLETSGNNCKKHYKWSWTQNNSNRHCHMVSVKEDPSGKYLISAGVRRSTSSTSQWNGYVVKLNSATGALIWEFDYKTSSGQRSGFETVHFTEDGGFIVGGYANMAGADWQGFKSGGQVEDGRPIMHKFSKATADANSLSSAPTPVWSYKCRASGNACTNNNGSVKNMRVYKEKGVEKVIALPTPQTVLLVLDASNGNDIMYSGDGIDSGFTNDGTCNDVEVAFDANGNVEGFVTTGLRFFNIMNDNGVSCANQNEGAGCGVINGSFTKYKPDLSGKIWTSDFNTGSWPGGDNGFAGATGNYDSLVYTECWGMSKVFDGNQNHIGYIAGCGSGVEPGCSIHPPAIQQVCKNDPRAAWRSALARIDLTGNMVWYALDSFVSKVDGGMESGESAAEYVFVTPEGRAVAVTDEGFGGFGFLTYECEQGVTCAGDGGTTTPETTKTTQSSTTKTTQSSTTKTEGTTPTTQSSTVSTMPTGSTPAACPEMQWKGKKATKIIYRGKAEGKRSYLIRQTVLNNSAQQDIRTGPYTGFFMFARRYCGTDFFDALSDGTITLGMYDYESTYTLKYKTTRIDGSKGTSVTYQYQQDFVGEADAPWTKKGGNSVKKDQFFLKIDGIPDSWDETKEADCLNLMVGVLPGGNDPNMDYSQCASTQKDAGW